MHRMTGEEVRSLRENLSLTQLDLAILTGATERTVRRWEQKGAGPVATMLMNKLRQEYETEPT